MTLKKKKSECIKKKNSDKKVLICCHINWSPSANNQNPQKIMHTTKKFGVSMICFAVILWNIITL